MKHLFGLLLLTLATSVCAQNTTLKLWYTKPSGTVWENALPVGNGRLGAMVYGNVPQETLQLNEGTVWSGSPNRNDNPNALAVLPEIRQLIFDGKQKEAEQLANKSILTKKSNGQMFQPVGNLLLTFAGHDTYTDYYRELDIERAVARTTYKVGDVTYTREVIASLPDNVLAVQLSADKPGKLSFVTSFTSLHPNALINTTNRNELMLAGTTADHEGVPGKVKFKSLARIKTKGGTVSANG